MSEPTMRTFSDLDWKGWFVLASVVTSCVVMVLDITTPDMVMCFEVLLFLATGILTLKEALEGFSSTGVWSPAVMFMVAQGLSSTGGQDYIIGKILGKPKDVTVGQIRLMLVVLCFSSFVSDTAVTAIMIPVVIAYCQKARMPLKQFMSILGYSALTGGTNTVIGTSTNLVISSMMTDRYGTPSSPHYRDDYGGLPPFSLTPYGIHASAWMVVACVLLAPVLLTDGEGIRKWANYFRPSIATSGWKHHQQFQVPLRVTQESPLAGMTVGGAGLLDLNFLYPVHIRSGSGSEQPVSPQTPLAPGDVLVMTGDLTKLPNLLLEWNLEPQVVLVGEEEEEGGFKAEQLLRPGGQGLVLSQMVAGGKPAAAGGGGRSSWNISSSSNGPKRADTAKDGGCRCRSVEQKAADQGATASTTTAATTTATTATSDHKATAATAADGFMSLDVAATDAAGPISRGPPVLFVAVVAAEGQLAGGPRAGCASVEGRSLGAAGFEKLHAVPLAVSRPKVRPLPPSAEGKQRCCWWSRGYHDVPCSPVQPPAGGTLADIVLQPGDRILLQAAQSYWRDEVCGPATSSSTRVQYSGITTEFSVPMTVEGVLGRLLLSGLTIKSAGYKGMAGAHLVGLLHPGSPEPLAAISEEERLAEGDQLVMVATAAGAVQLLKNPGLRFMSQGKIKDAVVDRSLMQASVGAASPLIGRTAVDVKFSESFQAVLVGLHRQGSRFIGDISLIPFQAGDVLLLEAGPTFLHQVAPENPCFSLVTEMPGTQPPQFYHVPVAVGATVACFTVYALGLRDIVTMMGLCTAIMLITRVMSPATARRAMDWKILITIGAALAVSKAMEKTGGAEALATALMRLGGGGEGTLIAVIYLTTMIVSQILMNTPAAAITFPVAATIADSKGIDIYVMSFAIMLAASAVYTTPFGDNVNLMTSGVGDYTVWEFMKFGIGVQLIVSPMTIMVLAMHREKALMAAVSGVVFGVVVLVPHLLAGLSWWLSRNARKQRARGGKAFPHVASGKHSAAASSGATKSFSVQK